MAPVTVELHVPLQRISNDNCEADDLLLNCLSKVGDTPAEDGIPLRTWILREAHQALVKDPKIRSVLLKPQAIKDRPIHFLVCFDE